MRNLVKITLIYIIGLVSFQSSAVTGVNPSGVNVSHTGVTTIFLTFQDLDAGETSVDAFWCGEVTTSGVSATNPCVAGTIFGRLPSTLNRSQSSTAGAFTNLTDIMTIPASVARRAFQAALVGNNSDFFYVRHFTGGAGGDRYVTVTCRMAGGGARVPLALLDVKVGFINDTGIKDPIFLLERGKLPSRFAASILYNGAGRLKGRWEIKLPGDPEPTDADLLTEATLPVEQRGLQRRYTVLDTFDVFLDPTGKVIIPGPNPDKLPNDVDGVYKILLRIEATRDKEGNSNTGAGTVISGGVAGFPMPVLRYYVGTAKALDKVRDKIQIDELELMLPLDDSQIKNKNSLEFSWIGVQEAKLYRIEIMNKSTLVASAVLPAGQVSYIAPPWVLENKEQILDWSVSAINRDGEIIARSKLRRLYVK